MISLIVKMMAVATLWLLWPYTVGVCLWFVLKYILTSTFCVKAALNLQNWSFLLIWKRITVPPWQLSWPVSSLWAGRDGDLHGDKPDWCPSFIYSLCEKHIVCWHFRLKCIKCKLLSGCNLATLTSTSTDSTDLVYYYLLRPTKK